MTQTFKNTLTRWLTVALGELSFSEGGREMTGNTYQSRQEPRLRRTDGAARQQYG